ncbi:MAG: PAS domain S-box protein [Gammaproteobacteria bacterium]|jgi:PAS domain S-box-containing protein|nr:PAS domain S-box protein [Gammaproteobacteria bacterium]
MNGASGSIPRHGAQVWRWLLPLVAITLLIGALSLWAYGVFSAEIREEAAQTLAGIAEEKRAMVEHWLADIESDTRTFFTGTSVTMLLLEKWIADGRRDQALLDRLRARLEEVARDRGWGGLTLYDDRGEPLAIIGAGGTPLPAERGQDLLRRPRLERLGANPGADGVWRYGLLAPVGDDSGPPLGVAALTWNLEESLHFAFLAPPAMAHSATYALARREGDTVRFLVSQTGALAGQQRSFREWPRLFAVLAAQGQHGLIADALDYRGVPVMGYATAIAGTPWILLAKIDQAEAEAERRELALALALATLLVLILLYAIGFGLWRWDQQRRAAIAREREEGLRRQAQQTRQWLDAILTSSTDAIFAKDPQGRYLLANPPCAKHLGLPVEQLLGHRDEELLPPAVAATLQGQDRRVLAGETLLNLEQTFAPLSGEGTYLTTKAPLRDAEGTIIGLYGIARDVTERQRQEVALRAAEATAIRLQGETRWKDALEAAGHGVWDWHVDSGRVDFSLAWKRMLGYDEADIGGDVSEWSRLVHPDDLAETLATVQAHLAGGTPGYTSIHRLRCKDGGWKWILDCGAVFERDAAGKPLRMLGTHTDITAQMEAEARLRESEQRLRHSEERARRQWIELEAIYTTAPVGLFVLDRELRFLRLNERLAEMNGLPVAAHLGRRVREIVPDLADVAEPLFQGVIDRGEPLLDIQLSGETAAQPGVQRHWREHFYPMRDASGQVVGINGVVEEITAIKRVEAEIRALNTDLEAKVAARTAEAEAASAAKSEFLAHMSHEIRTPLNAVLGLVQVMEQSSLTPAQRGLIERIRTAGHSLLLLLNEILDFSKIEAGQLQLEARPFVLAPLLDQLDTLLGASARAKGLRFTFDAAPLPDGALVGDPLRLEQVLTNLIGNAIKFTDQGEVRLSIRPLEQADDHARLRFEITDTGIGIAPAVLPHLFDAFKQADTGISRRFGGSGLGLAISKRLVDLMGGTLGVESQEGLGSTFWCELSFPRAAADPEPTAATPMARTATAGPRLAGRHYLTVDDNVLNLDVLERMLELEGARATRANDGREALARLRTQAEDFDAVLMDVQMPVLDGLSATRAIRGELGLSRLPVIAVTAGVLKAEQDRAREAGVDEVLSKPVDLDRLVAVLSRWAPRAGVGPVGEAVASAAPDAPIALHPAPAVTTLPTIAGIDPAHVARLTRGDVAFYRRLLSGLVAEARDVPAQVRADLAQGALTEAAARLHRLRGAAANVGALELATALRGLEAALREVPGQAQAAGQMAVAWDQEGSAVLDRLAAVEAQVATLLASAEDWLARATPAEPTTAVVPPAGGATVALDPAKLAALRAALATNRPRPARHLFAALRPALVGLYGEATVAALAARLDELKFAAALHGLADLMPTPDAAARPSPAAPSQDT